MTKRPNWPCCASAPGAYFPLWARTACPTACPSTTAWTSAGARGESSALIFHAALEGRKLANLRHCAAASFVAVAQAALMPEKFTTTFASVMASGTVRILEDREAKRAALLRFVANIAPMHEDGGAAYIDKRLDRCVVLELVIETLSGKRKTGKD